MSESLDHLDAEWEAIDQLASTRRFVATLAGHPLLACDSIKELALRLQSTGRTDPEQTDLLFGALLAMGEQEPLAQRVVLQALLPGICAAVRRRLAWSPMGKVEVVASEMLSIAADRIARYSVNPPHRAVACVIVRNTERDYLRQQGKNGRTVPLDLVIDENNEPTDYRAGDAIEDVDFAGDLLAVLRLAVAQQIIDSGELLLIASTRIGRSGIEDAAHDLGISPGTARRARHRGEQRLVTWWRQTEDPAATASPTRKRRPRAWDPDRPHALLAA